MQHARIDPGAHHWCCKPGAVDVLPWEKTPNLPGQLLPQESRAGEAAGEGCRSPGTLPTAGYEGVQKGSQCVHCSQLNFFWIDMGCISKWAVFIHSLTLNSGPG